MKVTRNPHISDAVGAPTEPSAPSPSAGSKRPRSPGALADLPQAASLNKRLRLSVSSDNLPVGPEVKASQLQALIGKEHAEDLDNGRLRLSASLNHLRTGPGVKAPQLQELIGMEHAEALDVQFGSLQPVRTKDGDGIHAWERDDAGKPLMHPFRLALRRGDAPPDWTDPDVKKAFDAEALMKHEKRYIWAVDFLGRVFIGEEVPVESSPDSEKQHYQGHPLLVGGGNARICGEIQFDAQSGKLKVINKSGRYSRYEDRTEAHLLEVGEIICAAVAPLGLEVETEYLSGKTPEALVLPSLDPSHRKAPDD